MSRQTNTSKIDEMSNKVIELDKALALADQRIKDNRKDIDELINRYEKLKGVIDGINLALERFKEQVDPFIRGAKIAIGAVLMAVFTALIALVIRK